MSRKPPGLASLTRHRLTSAQFSSHGSALRSTNAQALETQLAVFRSLLQQFAQTHAKDIRSNPSFRAQFARMCAAIGVDPLLASSSGGKDGGSVWSQLLGGTVNDFYFELAVRVVEVDDILRAVATLKPLGSAYSVIRVGSKPYIRSVPKELNTDQSAVLEAVQVLGYVSVSMLMVNLRWARARAQTAVEDLLGEGMLWVDRQSEEAEFWSPGFMLESEEGATG